MLSIKDLKKRIGSVKNTQQITRAMKMVSAAKLRKAQDSILHQRPYARGLFNLSQKIAQAVKSFESFPLVVDETNTEEVQNKKLLLVVVTLDRGLCGGFNINIIKKVSEFLLEEEKKNISVEILMIGKKGYDFFKRKKGLKIEFCPEFSGKVSFKKAIDLSEKLIQKFLRKEVTEIKFIYNEFVNALTQKVVIEDFLPFARSSFKKVLNEESDFIIKPNPPEVLRSILNKNFQMQVFKIFLESQAGEHGARMSAMENATKNASEMIRKLTLQFNKIRQENITKELLEIIAGSESQKNIK